MDGFAHFLWIACSMQLKDTTSLQFTQMFMDPPKEIDNRLLLSEHMIQARFRVTALKQIEKKGDEEKQDGDQKSDCFWLPQDVYDFPHRKRHSQKRLPIQKYNWSLSNHLHLVAGIEPEFLKAFLHDVPDCSKSMPIFNFKRGQKITDFFTNTKNLIA